MKNKYYTPIYDDCLKELGWLKFEDHPIYYRKVSQGRYEICFNVDWRGHQLIYEKMINKDELSKDMLKKMLVRDFESVCAKTICRELIFEYILMLTADFYYHNGNNELHQKYKQEYEQLTGKKY